MITIQELLHRIQWDPEFGKGQFEIGYYDRVGDRIIKIAFKHMVFDKDDHFSFQALDENCETHSIPLHRVKEVYKDKELIWNREHQATDFVLTRERY